MQQILDSLEDPKVRRMLELGHRMDDAEDKVERMKREQAAISRTPLTDHLTKHQGSTKVRDAVRRNVCVARMGHR